MNLNEYLRTGTCRVLLHTALYVPLALLAAGSRALAERDVEFVTELRQQGFRQLAEKEADRLLAREDLDEDTRVALTLEKARIARARAVTTRKGEAAQIKLVISARNALRAFLERYPARPERVDADFELQFLNRVLGQLRARRARFEASASRRAEFAKMARTALNEAADGYKRLRLDFASRRDALNSRAKKLRDLYDAERAKSTPDRNALRDIERKLEKLTGEINAAERSIIQCYYLAADSSARLGEALQKIPGYAEKGKAILEDACKLYDELFDTYKKTPYIETAYMSLCESVRAMCLAGDAQRAHRRIQAETAYFLITYREQIKKEDLFKKILARMRYVTAEVLNNIGRYKEARTQARLVTRGRGGRDFSGGARLEIARSYKGEGDIGSAARILGRLISEAGPYRRDAMDILLDWVKESPEIAAKFPTEIQFNVAMRLFAERRYRETAPILTALVKKSAGRGETKWAAKSLLCLAEIRYRRALAEKSELEGDGRISEGRAAYISGLKEAVGIIMDRLVARYGRSGDPGVPGVVRQSLYYALDWQNRILQHEPGSAQEARLEDILATFNRLFPGAPDIPDAGYLRGARLETEGRYAEAIEQYLRVSPERNQALVAKLRAALCRYRLYSDGKPHGVDEFSALWKELNEGIKTVSRALDADSPKLEEIERTRFAAALSEGEYVRALLLFSAGEEEVRAVLGRGANKHEKVKEMLADFARRYPSSAYLAQAAFMLARSKIALGEAEAAEDDVERLKQTPKLFKISLAALRDSYYNLYLQAEKRHDGDAARKFGEKYIAFAGQFAGAFREEMTADDMLRMGDYLYRCGERARAEDALSGAWRRVKEKLAEDGRAAPEDVKRAKAALRNAGEKLGEILIAGDDPEKLKKALEIYETLLPMRREALQGKCAGQRELENALKNDPLILHYRTRHAVAAISLQAVAGGEVPDFDSLTAAVKTLAQAARVRERFTREWWLMEYWMAYGLFLQRDFDSASRIIRNVRAVSGGFSSKNGAGEVGLRGKNFKTLFEELDKKIAFEQG